MKKVLSVVIILTCLGLCIYTNTERKPIKQDAIFIEINQYIPR